MAHDVQHVHNDCLQLSHVIGAIVVGALLTAVILWHGIAAH